MLQTLKAVQKDGHNEKSKISTCWCSCWSLPSVSSPSMALLYPLAPAPTLSKNKHRCDPIPFILADLPPPWRAWRRLEETCEVCGGVIQTPLAK